MNLFRIDYKKLVLLLLPAFLRRSRLFAFLCALTFGVWELHGRFLKNRDINLARIKRNGQICYLRGLLNDELDPVERRITITDGVTEGDWVFVFEEGEAAQLLIDAINPMIYNESLIIRNTAFFYISIPWIEEEENLSNRLNNYLNEYKLLSKKYIIKHGQTKF